MQPTMDACAWIHQARAQDRSWRPYMLSTPDAAMRTSQQHVCYPWQVFQRWQLQSPEGLNIKEVQPQDARRIKSSFGGAGL